MHRAIDTISTNKFFGDRNMSEYRGDEEDRANDIPD